MSDQGLTRRELLTRGAGAVVAAGAAVAGGVLLRDPTGPRGSGEAPADGHRLRDYFADVAFPTDHPRISVALGDRGDVEGMVRAAVGGLEPLNGMARFVKPGDRVLIKPNVGFDREPHLGATTDPEVLRWIIRLCRESGASNVVIADNPIESPDACFTRSGIRQVADAEGARVLWPSRNDMQVVVFRDGPPDRGRGEVLSSWPLFYSPLARADKLIGVAPVKDHNLCNASMSLKNWYGLLGGRRDQFHQAIHETVSDLGAMFSPTLVIADGMRVMMRNGPTGGRVTDVAPGGVFGRPVIVASVDPVACDAWCYENLLGRDPNSLPYLAQTGRKIAALAVNGVPRFGERDWHVYERSGRIVTTRV